jgi:hypothetical protein
MSGRFEIGGFTTGSGVSMTSTPAFLASTFFQRHPGPIRCARHRRAARDSIRNRSADLAEARRIANRCNARSAEAKNTEEMQEGRVVIPRGEPQGTQVELRAV